MNVVTIVMDAENKSDWSELRCVKCGKMMCHINRVITEILMGSYTGKVLISELDKPIVEIKCRGCNSMYNVLIQ